MAGFIRETVLVMIAIALRTETSEKLIAIIFRN